MKKGDVPGFRKILKLWPDGVVFNRLSLPNQYQDKWVMNDLVKRGFLIDLDHNVYQKTTRKITFHKRKARKKSTNFIGNAGRAFNKRVVEMTEMRAGLDGGAPCSYQEIADRFNVSRQRVNQILAKNGVAGRISDPNLLSTTDAAKYLKVSYRSIRDWAVTGTLPFYQKRDTGSRGRFVFRKEDLDTFNQQKLLIGRRTPKENQGLKPLVIRLLQLGEHPQEIAKLSGVGISTVYNWMYQMPGRDKRVGVALEKILSGDKMTLANLPNSATGE